MKKLLLLLIPVFLIGCDGYNKKTGFYGKVKSVEIKTYEADKKFGEYAKKQDKAGGRYFTEYTKIGAIKNQIIYNYKNTDNIRYKYIFIYDGKRHTGSVCYNEYGHEESTNKVIADNDDIQIIERYKSDTLYSVDTLFIFKEKDKIIQKTSFSEDTYYYNNNLLLKSTSKTEIDDYISESISKYEYLEFDNKNNWIKRVDFCYTSDNYSTTETAYIEERKIIYY